MVKFRKNNAWGSHSFQVNDSKSIDKYINENMLILDVKYPNNDIDIIDISIRSANTGESAESYRREYHYITFLFAVLDKEIIKGKIKI